MRFEHPDEALRAFYALWDASVGHSELPAADEYALRLECGHPVPRLTIPPEERTDIPTHVYCEACGELPEDELDDDAVKAEAHSGRIPSGYVALRLVGSMTGDVAIPDAPPFER